MTVLSNIKQKVDLPTWEWLRFCPVASSALSSACYSDGLNERYIYYLANATNFLRYDLVSDSWQQLATPPTTPVTTSSLRFTAYGGYRGNILGASSNTVDIAGLCNNAFDNKIIRIYAGTGAGQERKIISSNDNEILEHGIVTAVSANLITDTTKKWTINQFIGYQVRLIFNTGQSQVRKVLYNDANTLYFYDVNYQQLEAWNNTPLSATAPYALPVTTAGSQSHYIIEKNTCTLETNWDVTPNTSSSYVILSGGVWLVSSVATAPFMSLQYYDIASDTWTNKTSLGGHLLAGLGTDWTIDRTGEVVGSFLNGTATSGGNRTLTDTSKNMIVDRYCSYQIRITSGTGVGQRKRIVANGTNYFEVDTPWLVDPSNDSVYTIFGNTDMLYLMGNASSAMYKYNVEKDVWFQGYPIDFGQTVNMSVQFAGQEAFAISSGTKTVTGISTINTTPVAGGTGYVVGEIITLGTGTNGKVRVTSVNGGVVTGLEIFAMGTGYAVATASQSATNGVGTGCTCAITAVTTYCRIVTVQNTNFAKGDSVIISGCSESAWNSTFTIIGIDSLTGFDILLNPTANATASNSQSTTVIVDSTKNWVTGEHIGKLVTLSVAGTSPTTQIRRITANTATTLTVATIVAGANGTSRYVIHDLNAFGRDEQYRIPAKSNNGRATGGSTTTLIDTTKSWFSNQWSGYKFRILAGTGVGSEITITSNTTTTLTYSTQSFTPDATTKYLIMDTFGIATGTFATTTLADSTKVWGINQWAGKRVKFTGGTGAGQETGIVSNTANTLTFTAVTTAPDATTTYTILGIPVRGTGIEINWLYGNSNSDTKGKYLMVARGGGSNIFDKYDISTGTWNYTLFTKPQSETFTTGTMYAYDGGNYIYINVNATGRILRIDVEKSTIDSCGIIPCAHGTATIGNRMEIIKTEDGLYYLYVFRHTGQEIFRTLVFW